MTVVYDLRVGLDAEVGPRLKDIGMSMKVWGRGDDVYITIQDHGHTFARLEIDEDTLRDSERSPAAIVANVIESLVLLRLGTEEGPL